MGKKDRYPYLGLKNIGKLTQKKINSMKSGTYFLYNSDGYVKRGMIVGTKRGDNYMIPISTLHKIKKRMR